MSVVDAHHHLWDLTRNPLPWLEGEGENPLRRNFLLDELLEQIAGTEVSQTVCVQAGMSIHEARWLFDQGGADSPLAGVVAQADLGDPRFPSTLEAIRDCQGAVPLVGLRDPTLARRCAEARYDSWSSGLALVGALGLSMDLLTPDGSLGAVARLARDHEDLTLIVDHLGEPPVDAGLAALRRWSADLTTVAQPANVMCKLSGLRVEWPASHLRFVLDVALDAFGPSRLMFGSDWPVSPPVAGYRASYEHVTELLLDLSSVELQSVWADTARRVYGLA